MKKNLMPHYSLVVIQLTISNPKIHHFQLCIQFISQNIDNTISHVPKLSNKN